MSYDLKNLKHALDEQIPAPELNQDLLMRAQASRPKRKSTFAARALTTAAAVVLIVLSLSSLFAPILKPHIDDIGNDPYTLQQPNHPAQNETDNTINEIPENPESPEGFFFNPSGVGSWEYVILIVLTVYCIIRVFRKAKRKETVHMLLTESGFLVYVIALIVLAYRPMSGSTFWVMDDSIFHSSSSVYRYYGEPLISTRFSTEAVYRAVFGWSAASVAFIASFSAAYPKLRKRGTLLAVLAAVMLLPWAWKAVCLDMDATEWRIISNLIFYVLPTIAILIFLVPAVKRWMERFFKWCDRFEDLTAYSGASRKFWWWLVAAALLSLCLGSYYSGQEFDGLTQHTEVTYGYNKYCDEEWFSSVNESYALYREQMEAGDEQGALRMLRDAVDDRAFFAVQAMYEHQIDELTPDRLLMVWVDVKLTTKRPFYGAHIQLEYEDTPYIIRPAEDERLGQGRADLPISCIWFNAGNEYTPHLMNPSGMITECEMRAFTLYIMPEQQVDTQDILKNVTRHLCIEQYPYFDFAMQKVYTDKSRLDGSAFDEENTADTHGRPTGDFYPAIVLGIVCLLIGLIGKLQRGRREKETYIDDDVFIGRSEKIMRMMRICLGVILSIMLCLSWITVITALMQNMSFGVEAMGFISFKNVLINSLNSNELSGMIAVTGNMVLCYGLVWAIYRLLSPKHKGSRHWLLLAFLSYEIFQHIVLQIAMRQLSAGVVPAEEISRMVHGMIPSMIAAIAAWMLTLIQNIYYKWIER